MTKRQIKKNTLAIMEFMGLHVYYNLWEKDGRFYPSSPAIVSDTKLVIFDYQEPDFFGGKKCKCFDIRKHKKANIDVFIIEQYNYHQSLDLMKPVFDKFRSIPLSEFNYNASAMSKLSMLKKQLAEITIIFNVDYFYQKLVSAIESYNQLKSKKKQ